MREMLAHFWDWTLKWKRTAGADAAWSYKKNNCRVWPWNRIKTSWHASSYKDPTQGQRREVQNNNWNADIPEHVIMAQYCLRSTPMCMQSSCPRMIHDVAVKWIVQYLKGTHDKGYILCPSKEKWLDCYIDADFMGIWDMADSDDTSSVKSRTGYVITFANCPVLWVSKLQTEITLSPCHKQCMISSQCEQYWMRLQELWTWK